MKRVQLIGLFVAFAVLGAAECLAQEPLDLQEMATQMRRNQEELRKYSWETKIVFEVDGKQRRVDHYTVRYVMGGMLERMQISSAVAKEKIVRPDGSKLKKKELEAARAFAMDVKKQLDAYLNPLFAEKIVATSTAAIQDGMLVLRSRDIVTTGDSAEVNFVESTRLPKTMTVVTTIDGSPADLQITFGSIDYGPNYTASSITRSAWEGIRLAILTENSNFEQQSR